MTVQTTGSLGSLVNPQGPQQLPPLILHPFAESTGPHKLVASSRASLMLQGLLPSGDASAADLQKTLLDGRYSEIRMLFYVGKDILRWIDQCLDGLKRSEGSLPSGILPQSFSSLLIQHTPEVVVEKLKRWSVSDYKAIFSRGLGLNAMFGDIPPQTMLSEEFCRNYFRYADQLFFAWQSQAVYTPLNQEQFKFDLYSSGEYSRILERSWE